MFPRQNQSPGDRGSLASQQSQTPQSHGVLICAVMSAVRHACPGPTHTHRHTRMHTHTQAHILTQHTAHTPTNHIPSHTHAYTCTQATYTRAHRIKVINVCMGTHIYKVTHGHMHYTYTHSTYAATHMHTYKIHVVTCRGI